MKRTSIFLISFFIVVITFGQDINLPLYLDKKINELMFIDNYSVENQTLDNIYYQRIKRPDLKSNLDVTQKLDSIQTMIYHLELNLWTLSTKNEFTYDEKGNTTIIIEYDWKSNIEVSR